MQGSNDTENDLATTYMNKANSVAELGDQRGAVVLYDRCIAIWERMVESEGRGDLANDLATAYMNKANVVGGLGDVCGAVALFDRGIAIQERLVEREGRSGLANHLATSYYNKACALMGYGDLRGAIMLFDRCIAVWERMVKREGRSDLANYLTTAYKNKAKAVEGMGSPDRNWEGYYEAANDNALILNKDITRDYLVIRGINNQCEVPRAILAGALLMAKQWGWEGGIHLYKLLPGRVTLINISEGVTISEHDSQALALILFNNIIKDMEHINDDDNAPIASVIRVCIEGEVTIYQHK